MLNSMAYTKKHKECCILLPLQSLLTRLYTSLRITTFDTVTFSAGQMTFKNKEKPQHNINNKTWSVIGNDQTNKLKDNVY